MKNNPAAIANLASNMAGELVEIRVVLDGKTVSIVVDVDSLAHVVHSGHIQLIGKIKGADFDEGIDGRVTRQRKSIDRLLDHVKAHCPEFNSGQACEHNGGTE